MVELKFDKNSLIPAVVQDSDTNEVLMVAYMNQESFDITMKEGRMCYWSRSRKKLWRKGETSGNVQVVKEVLIDCDNDCLLFKVEQIGKAACHTGYNSCFYRKIDGGETKTIKRERIFNPEEVYK